MANFWEMTAHSVLVGISIIFHFGFEDRILILIIVHGNCLLFTFPSVSSVSNAYICNSYYFYVCCFYDDAFTIDHVVIFYLMCRMGYMLVS